MNPIRKLWYWFEDRPHITIPLMFVIFILLWWPYGPKLFSRLFPPRTNGFEICEPSWSIGDVRYRCQFRDVDPD